MDIYRKPSELEVKRLLAQAGLPATDISPSHLEHFFGCGSRQAPQGVVGLEVCGQVALLRSLAVGTEARGRGCGKALVDEAERYARTRGVSTIYLLTVSAVKFFEQLGYRRIDREDAPDSIRATKEFSALCPVSSALMSKKLGDL